MRVTILGCGGSAGVPQLGGADGHGDWGACDPAEPRNRRTRTSIVVESAACQRLLVDTGPEMRCQLLAAGVPKVDAVLFTHSHADHITGLDDVRILNRLANSPLPAFGTQFTLGELAQRFDYAFLPWKPPTFFRPVMVPQPFEYGDTIEAAGMAVQVFEQDHRVMKTTGLRIGQFGYSTDVVNLDETAFATLAGIDTWLVGCFQRAAHSTHANFERVLGWAKRVGARRTVLTHMGPDLDWAWMQQRLPPGVEPGWDGQVLEILD
ncbi:MBL fold metallo-hydrolase [Acidisphaera sp. L21]|jgi:phosphoribosyl 1,2-cyclic phosphate phosphodiesterase|uniref:MBL fold metallo-hydrolase n=1 Tax=Acidisphaera sp. L21 TaxID=1641851 RepID=UPI00131A8FF4|nr:MBL fold metallo-hydrolase [Acidisphaera sp. L21]